jgi:hypothetical protein
MDDGYRDTSEESESDEPLLAAGKPIVFEGESKAFEDTRSVNEVESVRLQVGGAFYFRPCELHAAMYIQRVMTSTERTTPCVGL